MTTPGDQGFTGPESHPEPLSVLFSDPGDGAPAAAAPERKEENFRQLFEHVASGIAIKDLGGRFVRCNPTYQALLGYPEAELRGLHFSTLVHPEDREANLGEIRRLLAGDVPAFEIENRYLHREGRPTWVRKYVSLLRDQAGQPTHFIVLVTDITERRQAEERLRQSEATLRSFYESSPFLMGVVELPEDDSDIRHIYDNPATRDFLGLPLPASGPRSAREMGVPAEIIRLWARHYRQSERQGRAVQFEYCHPTPGGEKWLSCTVSHVLTGESGSRYSYVAEDVTARKLAAALAERQARLIQLSYEPIIVWDLEGGIVEWNAGAERLYGYSAAEALGRSSHELLRTVHPLSPEEFRLLLERQGEWHGELCHRTRDGREVLVESRHQVVETGGRRLVLETNRDITARKRAETELAQREERLELAARAARMFAFEWDPATGLVRRSRECGPILGLSGCDNETEEPASHFFERLHPDDRAGFLAVLESLSPERESYRATYRAIGPGGRVVTLEESARGYFDAAGRLVRLVGMTADVTERAQAEAELRDSERRLELALEAGRLGFWDWHIPSGHVHFSRQWAEMLGYAPEEVEPSVGAWEALVHPDDLPGVMEVLRGHLEGRLPYYETVHRVWTGSGEWRWILDRGRVVERDAAGRPVRALGTHQDVTEQQQARDALQESEYRLRTTLEALPQLVWTCRPDGCCDYLSPQWLDYTGLPEAEQLGYGWLEVLHPEDRERAAACWRAAVEQRGVYDLEYRIRRHDGAYRWFKTRGVPLKDRDGRTVRWFGTCTDVHTEREAREALAERDRQKDQFMAMLAHELRNPLAPVRNAVEIARHRLPADAEVASFLQVIERQTCHMARLVDDLLDATRLALGRQQLRRQAVDLAEVLQPALEAIMPQIQHAGQRLQVDPLPGRLCLHGDPDRLQQVFSNLLRNANLHTPSGGAIRVSVETCVEEGTRRAVVRVRDTGEGIAPELLAHIWEPFVQADQGLARTRGGLGIGLSIVRGLVEGHGGTVEARSEGLGQGSEFVIRLPLLPEEAPAASAPPAPPTHVPTEPPAGEPAVEPTAGRPRVLVVDDNQDAAETLTDLLDLWDYPAEAVYDGPSALRRAEEYRPGVILLDIGLPGMDGYEVARRLREAPVLAGALIVAVTGYASEADQAEAREAGFDHHLPKPVDPARLRSLLEEALSAACR